MYAIVTTLCFMALLPYKCCACNVSNEYYPYYHLAPPCGWMNDPNGFCIYRNEYHLFYQYNPKSSQEPGIAHWGHAKSNDLCHWKHLPIAMYPDKKYDRDGVFSGSAIVENNTMYIIYTGNVNHADEHPDHNNRQAVAYSKDGINVTKYPENPVIKANGHQPNIRDPKIWKHRGIFYIVLGNSFDNGTRGRVLLYSSKDLFHWNQLSVLEESDGSLGYMWECPDFFPLNGKWVLLFSPQGIKPQGDKYKNLYQVGYFVGDFDCKTHRFTVTSEFRELDHGHDFYATQTLIDKSGRRIMIAWFDMWGQVYPERNDGWTGQMTIPRVLHLTHDHKLIQRPVKEVMNARGDELFSGKANDTTSVEIKNNAGFINITARRSKDFELILCGGNVTMNITYNYSRGRVALNRGGDDGIRRTNWRPTGKLHIQIFVDRSSVEVFYGKGEVTFSSRFFPRGEVKVMLGKKSRAEHMSVHCMERTLPAP